MLATQTGSREAYGNSTPGVVARYHVGDHLTENIAVCIGLPT